MRRSVHEHTSTKYAIVVFFRHPCPTLASSLTQPDSTSPRIRMRLSSASISASGFYHHFYLVGDSSSSSSRPSSDPRRPPTASTASLFSANWRRPSQPFLSKDHEEKRLLLIFQLSVFLEARVKFYWNSKSKFGLVLAWYFIKPSEKTVFPNGFWFLFYGYF